MLINANAFPIGGLRIVQSEMCTVQQTKWEVAPHPIRKRRRGWCVRSRRIEQPTAYMAPDGTLVVHPSLYQQLRAMTAAAAPNGGAHAQGL